jgi:hypothetical protein
MDLVKARAPSELVMTMKAPKPLANLVFQVGED